MSDRSPNAPRRRAERRDAVANREKILRTAAATMAVRGHHVPLTEIADAAGVGVGTFYRAFPDRTALVAELQRRGCELLLDSLTRIAATDVTGAAGIEAYLSDCLEMADELVALPLRGGEPFTDEGSLHARDRIGSAIDDLLARGRRDGSVHDDVRALDVIVFGTLLAMPLPHGPDWKQAARRQLTVFVRGIRATG